MGKTISKALSALGKGAITLIEEMAKSFGEGIGTKLIP